MWLPWRGKGTDAEVRSAEARMREHYRCFRDLLAYNNECLERMASLQEDLQYVPPLRDVIGPRIAEVFDRARGTVEALETLTENKFPRLVRLLARQRHEVEAFVAAGQERETPRLAASLAEIDLRASDEVGGKTAYLGEVRNHVGLPVPEGFVLTTEAYRQTVGIPLWREIRDALREVDPDDLEGIREASRRLVAKVLEAPIPRAVEVALMERAKRLDTLGQGFAVRSSAVGEGGPQTFAGQFLSLLNVPENQLLDAYRKVLASRFSERAIAYRRSRGIGEVESPMAVLVIPVLRAKAAGILYTRDPNQPSSGNLLITATRGLGVDLAGGSASADLFVLARGRSHAVLERHITRKESQVVLGERGGIARRILDVNESRGSSMETEDLQVLAHWGVRLEAHFKAPQDVEWVLDEDGALWIVQTRDLALGFKSGGGKSRGNPRAEPLLKGGKTIYGGRASGPAFHVEDVESLAHVPSGAILFVRRPMPDIVKVLNRIAGVVAERGIVTGHGAALLREFKIPSAFQMAHAMERTSHGSEVSLDAGSPALYGGILWAAPTAEVPLGERYAELREDPIHSSLLTLNLVDPSAFNFRASGCRSAHDILRFSHEKAIETMFSVNDRAADRSPLSARRLVAATPIRLFVLDLGGGVRLEDPETREILPEQITSRPFAAFWCGVTHPGVSWSRQMPASLNGLASVVAGSFASHSSARRALGERSYLLVADEYMNLNSRLAYHFTLVDACLSDQANANYISFRFAGGGATRWRRNLRAVFIEKVLSRQGFLADRRGDVVNAWHRKGTAEETAAALDILGRLMACSSQLDMYMESHEAMEWYVAQFMAGNYRFDPEASPCRPPRESGR
ncbi:MAG: PEP/pyruvate-binding domain-containing protein [Acidobacteriota bacterium]